MIPNSFNGALAITKSDTVNLPSPCSAIFVGGAGTVAVVFTNDLVCNFAASAGTYLLVAAKRVNSTNTDASNLVACYF